MTTIEMGSIPKLGSIEMYSHFLLIRSPDARVRTCIRRVLREWTVLKEQKGENAYGEVVRRLVPDKIFGFEYSLDNEVVFQIHKSQLSETVKELMNMGIDLDNFDLSAAETYTPEKCELELLEGRVLRDYQDDATDFSLSPEEKGGHHSRLIGMPTGTGKALVNGSLVLTPSKWCPIEELKVGDEVIAQDGSTCTVTGVFPQGVKDTSRVVFEDGRVSKTCNEHLWGGYDNDGDYKVPSTKAISDMLGKGQSFRIPLFQPAMEYDARDDFLAYADLWSYLRKLRTTVNFVDLIEYIPVWQRVGLIRWMVLRDANPPSEDSQFKVDNAHEASILKRIIFSLGGKVTESSDKMVCTPNAWVNLVCRVKHREEDEVQTLLIDAVEDNGKAECTCISIDHPSKLFVTDDYIVTHNTVTLCGAIAKEGVRTVIGILPKYAEKWEGDLKDNLNLKDDDILSIEEPPALIKLIHRAKKHGTKGIAPIIIVTLTTWYSFCQEYVDDPKETVEKFGCAPWEFWKLLKVGLTGIDESHEHLFKVFMFSVFQHGPKFIALSGTMLSPDPFEEKVQKMIFPVFKRYDKIKMEKYIDVEYLAYSIAYEYRRKVRISAFGRTTYSHVEFEKSIMKDKHLLKDYLKLMTLIFEYGYIEVRKPGDRFLIYVATTELAGVVHDHLTRTYPDMGIEFNRYTKSLGDTYESIRTKDVSVTTIQSAGTALDIANLIGVLCSTMISSPKSNLQVLGRLRKLVGKAVRMFMPFCTHIRQHNTYTNERRELFEDRVKSQRTFNYGIPLGFPGPNGK